jgi:arsenate reductase-like glutaredoxin family protein
MDNIDIIFNELKRNEIDIDKQTLSFHINTMINQHCKLYREMNTHDLNLEQVYREINVTNFGRINTYLAFVCLQNYSEESIRHKNRDIF